METPLKKVEKNSERSLERSLKAFYCDILMKKPLKNILKALLKEGYEEEQCQSSLEQKLRTFYCSLDAMEGFLYAMKFQEEEKINYIKKVVKDLKVQVKAIKEGMKALKEGVESLEEEEDLKKFLKNAPKDIEREAIAPKKQNKTTSTKKSLLLNSRY